MDLRRAVPLLLAWVAVAVAALVVPLTEALPFRLGFVRPGNLLAVLVEAQVFFAVLVWPLFLEPAPPLREGLARLGALLLLAMPLVLVAANVSDAGGAAVARAELLVAALAAVAWGVRALFGPASAPAYYAAAFLASAFLPFAAFLSREMELADLSGLSVVSPFWAAAGTSWVPPILFAALAAGLLCAARLFRREVDASRPPG